MTDLRTEIAEAVASIRKKTQARPRVGIVLGTGLGALAKEIQAETSIPYDAIPHMPLSTVESHHGELVFGKLGDKDVVAMRGRFHLYEGYSARQVAFPVRVLRALGASELLISNACGGMNRSYAPGDLMILDDHLNFQGANPLVGPHDPELGPRWPDMSQPYDRELIALAERSAASLGIPVRKGVYAAVLGPNLETRAEYRMLGAFADVVGMSTVPEVIAAVHGGMRCLGISVVTDECFPENLKPADVAQIIRIASEAEPKLTRLMKEIIQRL